MEQYLEIRKFFPGSWIWNEEKKELEFSRSLTGQISKILLPRTSSVFLGSQEKLNKGKIIRFPDCPADRLKYSRFKTALEPKAPEKAAAPTKAKRNKFITLEDIKRVALPLLEMNQRQCLTRDFTAELKSKELDDFLLAAVHYMSLFLMKRSKSKKPPSLLLSRTPPKQEAELRSLEDQLKAALTHLATRYCQLILGTGRQKQHMDCGKSKSSATWSDLRFFEALYNFCTKVTWVTLWRKKLEVMQEEFGRIFRTEHFNTKMRIPEIFNIFRGSPMTPSAPGDSPNRKPKKPSFQTVMRRCSPLLTTVLPTSIDKSPYLFERHGVHPKVTKDVPKKIDLEYEVPSRTFSLANGQL
ncbi:protein phosphatase 1 regulatory subunit 36-like [Leptodactylus fuscus]|uniref:protein phosphatase 1 regulatory subunit 36-like n=1 Tax=Leptodactylus fuscus TaxID=238119 RepID=UPI003F4F3674